MIAEFISQFNEYLYIIIIFLPKVIKLRKLITGAKNLKTRIRKYRGEAHDGIYVEAPMHTLYDGQR